VRLEKARSEIEDDGFSNRYTRAANTLGTWRSDGVVIEDEKPSFYLLEQVFQGADGQKHSRIGLVAKVKLDEDTPVDTEAADALTGARADYLEMIRNTNPNISGVAAVFADPDHAVTDLLQKRMKERPWEELTDAEGIVHRLWVVQKKDVLLAIVDALKSRELFIAEGRHRYLAAQIYRDERRTETGKSDGKQPFDHIMMTLFPAEQEGLFFSAMHRGLTRTIMADVNLKDALEELGDYFDVEKDKADLTHAREEAARLQAKLAELGRERPAIALVHGSGAVYYLALQPDTDAATLYDDVPMMECVSTLDACILHNFIINQVLVGNPEYELEDDECVYMESGEHLLELLRAKKIVCGFMLNPLTVSHMVELAAKGAKVPLETGVLSPRTCTGLVLRNLQTDIRKPAKK
jgi:uncharacterized protein (DUF1015 family)